MAAGSPRVSPRVAIPTASQDGAAKDALGRYLRAELLPSLEALGFAGKILEIPRRGDRPF